MDEILKNNKGNLLLLTKSKNEALNFFKNKDDVYIYETYNLDIDDVRAINSKAILKSNSNMIFVISCYIAGIEAQNAMLKMLEDYIWCQFIFICESEETLIPTVRSRLSIHMSILPTFGGWVESFIKMNIQERLKSKEILAMLAKETKQGKKQKDDAHRFVVDLISYMLKMELGVETQLQKINELHEIANYILKHGVSAKQMIEYICYRV